MEVNKISATVRYSQDTGKGSWKVVELGAEATISALDSYLAEVENLRELDLSEVMSGRILHAQEGGKS